MHSTKQMHDFLMIRQFFIRKKIYFTVGLLLALAVFPASGRAGSMNYIIYNESMRNWNYEFLPISNYLNTALDSAQCPMAFQQKGYFNNHARVFKELSNPVYHIVRDGGFKKFFSDEWLTTRTIPNYTLHLFGGGYDFRFVAEWFDYHGFPAPYLFSFVTTYMARIGNKAIESTNKFLTSHNDLSDLLFFDIIGNLLYVNDDIARFFYKDLGVRNWAGQPMINIRSGYIMNCSNNFIIRPNLSNDYIRPFAIMGMQYFGGMSFYIDKNYSLTLSAGVAVTKAFNPDHDSLRAGLKKMRPAGGIYFDRDGTILASAIINGTEGYKFRLNIYPELLKVDYLHMGLFLAVDDYNRVLVGINFYSLFGIGATF